MEKTEKIVTRVNKSLKTEFKRRCKLEHTTESQKVRDLINEWVKNG